MELNFVVDFPPIIEQHIHAIWRNQLSVPVKCGPSSKNIIETIKYSSSTVVTALMISFDIIMLGVIELQNALELIKNKLFNELEAIGLYNWTRCTMPVIPLNVPDDGNSLCNAVSTHIFGIPDQSLFIRRCLHATCQKHLQQGSPLHMRWVKHKMNEQESLVNLFNDENMMQDLNQQWIAICSAASTNEISYGKKCTNTSKIAHSFYVFVLSQICKRAIIVVGLTNDEFESSVFLPVMIPSEECVKCPIYLAYHRKTFTPLVFLNKPNTDERILDTCIPLTHPNFKLFKFPFLSDDEDGLTLLSKYARDTKIGYTTETAHVEVPAVRLPVKQFTDKNEFGVNSVFRLCLKAYQHSRNPHDLSNMWNHVSTFQPSYSRANVQKSFNSFQPEDDDIECDDIVTEKTNNFGNDKHSQSNHIASSHTSIKRVDTSHPQFTSTVSGQTSMKHPSLPETNQRSFPRHSSQLQNYDQPSFDGEINATIGERNHENGFLPPGVGEIPLEYFNDTTVQEPNSLEETFFNEVQDIFDEQPNPLSRSPKIDDSQPNGNSLATSIQSAIIMYISSSQLIVKNPEQVSFSNLQLEIKDEIKVKVKLVKETVNGASNNPTRLLIEKLMNLNINYKHVGSDKDLEMKLTKIDDQYNLCIKLPSSVIVEDQTAAMKCVASVWSDDSECGSPFIEMENHQQKCRTGGCIGLAVRQYRGLCAPCHKSWNEMLDRHGEPPTDFDDSSSSEESDGCNRKCKVKNCKNSGEKRFYGFCFSCFHKPNL